MRRELLIKSRGQSISRQMQDVRYIHVDFLHYHYHNHQGEINNTSKQPRGSNREAHCTSLNSYMAEGHELTTQALKSSFLILYLKFQNQNFIKEVIC